MGSVNITQKFIFTQLFPGAFLLRKHRLNEVCRIGEMVLCHARNETAAIAALFRGFVTQQGTKSSRQDGIRN